MNILKRIQFLKNAVLHANYYWKLLHDSKFLNERYLGEILRNTHSLEKGLSLENIRKGFGLAKVQATYSIILNYKSNGGDMSAEPLVMFVAALKAYLNYHKSANFSNENICKITKMYKELSPLVHTKKDSYGGTLKISRKNFNEEEQDIIARLFNSRHSMREFCNLPVDDDKLKMAIELAMRCPSACNRLLRGGLFGRFFRGSRFFCYFLSARGAHALFLGHIRAAMVTLFHTFLPSAAHAASSQNRLFSGRNAHLPPEMICYSLPHTPRFCNDEAPATR